SDLYGKFDKFIPAGTKVPVKHTQQYLSGIKQRFDDLPELAAIFNDPHVNRAVSAFDNLGQPVIRHDPVLGTVSKVDDTLKYDTVRDVRSVIGRKLNSASLDGDARATMKQMYGALSKDMEAAAKAQGNEAFR